jgi:hypothetical protein
VSTLAKPGKLKEFVDAIHTYTSKRLLFVDVRQLYAPRIEKIFDEKSIIMMQPYKSSNGSKMVTFILKLR